MTTYEDEYRRTRAAYAPPPTKKRGKTPEAKVSRKVCAYLDAITSVNLRTGAGLIRTDNRAFSMGKKGTADRTCCLLGRSVAVETKATTTMTPDQIVYRDAVLSEGGVFIEAHSVDDLRAALGHAFGVQQLAAWDALVAERNAAQRRIRKRVEHR